MKKLPYLLIYFADAARAAAHTRRPDAAARGDARRRGARQLFGGVPQAHTRALSANDHGHDCTRSAGDLSKGPTTLYIYE